MGLIPIPESSGITAPISSARKRMSLWASGVPSRHSIPAYTSSVFSRKMTMSRRSGCTTGAGTPGKARTGRTQA